MPSTPQYCQATSTDRFYPDFVCKLCDGRILVVEYKAEKDWSNDDSKEKRALGELWADLSDGRCLFIMPKGPALEDIHALIQRQEQVRNPETSCDKRS